MKIKILILAGGIGSRLWPLSRERHPKQMHPLLSGKSVLQTTYEILRRQFGAEDIYIGTTTLLARDIQQHLKIKRDQLIIEPARRDTAAPMGLAAVRISKKDPEAIVIKVSADHFIGKPNVYLRSLMTAARLIAQQPDYLMTIGCHPTYAETGYGYIEVGKVFNKKVRTVAHFKEKPSLPQAQKFIKSRKYLWNTGIFIFRADSLLRWFSHYLPHHYAVLTAGTVSRAAYASLEKVPIDTGIVEKMSNVLVLPASFGWYDIGHWKTIADILPKDRHGTSSKGPYVMVDSSNNLVYSEATKLVATLDVHNMVIVDTADALLVMPQDRAQDVKLIVDELKRRKLDKYI